MIVKTPFKQALLKIVQRPLRNALTTLGIMVGTGLLFCMVSFSLGIENIISQQAEQFSSLNTITVLPGAIFRKGARWKKAKPSVKKLTPLNDATVKRLKRIPGVFSAQPMVQFPIQIEYKGYKETIFCQNLEKSKNMHFLHGHFLLKLRQKRQFCH